MIKRVRFGDCEDRCDIETGRGWDGIKGDGVERARRCEELVRDGWLVKMRGDRLGVERMREGWSMGLVGRGGGATGGERRREAIGFQLLLINQ